MYLQDTRDDAQESAEKVEEKKEFWTKALLRVLKSCLKKQADVLHAPLAAKCRF